MSQRTNKRTHRRIMAVSLVMSTVLAVTVLAACGSGGTQITTASKTSTTSTTKAATTVPTTTSASGAPVASNVHYNPKIVPSQFTDKITNPYTPWIPGTTHIFKGTRDGVPTKTRVSVTNATKTIMGVKCVTVQDVVTSNGSLVEKTTDWYSQDSKGNVWYFGEQTAEYANGVVTTTAGTWEAGVDKAKPGIVMEAHPKKGDHYRQEFRPGVALDKATVLSTNATRTVPGGTYHHLVATDDINPLDPSKHETKWFAKGIGFIEARNQHNEVSKLVK
ncbi:MAG: hypothetical protein ACRDMH_09555 [Solirubrobacterales bacterium]